MVVVVRWMNKYIFVRSFGATNMCDDAVCMFAIAGICYIQDHCARRGCVERTENTHAHTYRDHLYEYLWINNQQRWLKSRGRENQSDSDAQVRGGVEFCRVCCAVSTCLRKWVFGCASEHYSDTKNVRSDKIFCHSVFFLWLFSIVVKIRVAMPLRVLGSIPGNRRQL